MSQPSGRDRRRFARIALTTKVRLAFPGVQARRELLLENLSEGGLFIRSEDPKPVGTKLEFEFSVRDGGPSIVGKGVVRWVEAAPETRTGMGIKFLELNEVGRKELAALIRKRKGLASN